MAKYIEREAVLKIVDRRVDLNEKTKHVFQELISLPAADVAPVVRCRECIHRYGTPGQPNILCFQMKDDDFCSYGAKMDGGEKDGH